MYQRVEKQEKFSEETLECTKIKKEFDQSVKEDLTHKNEDSAKKQAVHQGMDYDGFHQMVLGANLKPIKKGDGINVTSNKGRAFNLCLSNSQIKTDTPIIVTKIEEEKISAPRNQEEFDKMFSKKLVKNEEKYKYLKEFGLKLFGKLFSGEVDSELFLRIIKLCTNICENSIKELEITNEDYKFITNFLHCIFFIFFLNKNSINKINKISIYV